MRKQRNIARLSITTLALVGLICAVTLVLGPARPASAQTFAAGWTVTGDLNTSRSSHTATLLPTGKVLVVGGFNGTNFLNSAELYDPAAGTWSLTGALSIPRYLCTATLLQDGRVLVAGGYTSTRPPDFGVTNTAELYDPVSGTWSPTGNLTSTRAWHTATLLRNGKVLIAGGGDVFSIFNSAELYDPATGTWSVIGSLTTARYGQTATLLQDGNVLIAGGSDEGDLWTTLASVELYDPGAGTWTSIDSLGTARMFHSATLLPGGKVLASGAYTRGYNLPPTSLNSAELYDPAIRNWSPTGSLNGARNSHTATLLPSGKVLVAGGQDWNRRVTLTGAELFDLATGSWTIAADLNTARDNHSATLLPNGKVLVAGGFNNITGTLDSAELYDLGTVSVSNPIDDAQFLVRQQYLDFLGREPDAPGLAHWTGEITQCDDPAKRQPGESLELCTVRKRANTSAAFFLSPEFQNTGSFVLRVYWGTLGKLPSAQCGLPNALPGQCRPLYSDYIADMGKVAQGIVVNDKLAPDVINANKRSFVDQFVNKAEFKASYDGLNNQQFVDQLFTTTGIVPSDAERSALVNGLNTGAETRSSVVFKVVDGTVTIADGALVFETTYGQAFFNQEFDAAFVFMEYIGYLRRNPDQEGYDFWLAKMKRYGNWVDAEMVLAFVVSPEYRARFAQ